MAEEDELAAVVDSARGGSDESFALLVERFRPELLVHCYRMLGSLDEAEDTVQDIWVQAWRGLPDFESRSSIRTWLYRIATRACLARNTRDRRRRALLAPTSMIDGVAAPVAATVPWLQPLPDQVLDSVVARGGEPAERLASRETVEIAFIAALQHLPGQQRAAVVLRDVVGWPADRCATELGVTVASLNGALRRGRATLRSVLGADRASWPAARPSSDLERELVRRYIAAIEAGDDDAIAALLRSDAMVSHQPRAGSDTDQTGWYRGRDTVLEAWAPALHGPMPLQLRLVALHVNRQPAVASYARVPGTTEHRAFGLAVLTFDGDQIAEVVNLTTDTFPRLGIPLVLPNEPNAHALSPSRTNPDSEGHR